MNFNSKKSVRHKYRQTITTNRAYRSLNQSKVVFTNLQGHNYMLV